MIAQAVKAVKGLYVTVIAIQIGMGSVPREPREVDQSKSQGSSWEDEHTPTPTVLKRIMDRIRGNKNV